MASITDLNDARTPRRYAEQASPSGDGRWQKAPTAMALRPRSLWGRPALWIVGLALVVVIVATGIGWTGSGSACSVSGGRSASGMICLGDGSVLDPGTSLVWKQRAPDQDCAAIDPLASWRAATTAELATLPVGLSSADRSQASWCVIDQLARILPPKLD